VPRPAPARAGCHDTSPELRRGPWPSNPSARRVVQSVDEGFDWRSAAIGTGGAGALILPASVGGSTYRHRHEHLGVARQPATGSRA
jgi:hypothetical protein